VSGFDLSALAGGTKTAAPERKPSIEYKAHAKSSVASSDVTLTIDENSFLITSLFGAAEIPFAEVNEIALRDYSVYVCTDTGNYTFSRMGEWAERFHNALLESYNKAVLRSLFIAGNPIVTAKGTYSFSETGSSAGGTCPVYVFEDCIASLPPNLNARRIPFRFLNGMEKGDYSLTLLLSTGESYTFQKLGYDTAVFASAVEKQITKLRTKTAQAVKNIDPSLSPAQTSRLSLLMPEGTAAPLTQAAAIAPSFAKALGTKLAGGCASDSLTVYLELSDPDNIYAGFRSAESVNGTSAGNVTDLLESAAGTMPAAEAISGVDSVPEPYVFWLIAPSPDGRFAAVEFAEEDTATFVYRTDGNFPLFAARIGRALEAINFKREVIRLTAQELKKPENSSYYMAAKRTAALQFVRSNFVGRIIHSNPAAWKRSLLKLWAQQ